MGKIKFNHFVCEDGTTTDTINISLGNLNMNEYLDDVEVEMKIVNGDIEFDILNKHYYDVEELKSIQDELLMINWDGGYEFFDLYNSLDNKVYHMVGDRTSTVSDSVNSQKNLQNLQAVANKLSNILGVKQDTPEAEVETKEVKIGKFTPKRKFISFVSAVQGARVRFFRETAYIDGKQLSGVLEGAKFKITICDEGTIDFEVVENNSLTTNIDDSMLERLISSIDDTDVTGYAQKFIVHNLEFKDEEGSRCYLEVEHQKPIDRFASILEALEEETVTDTTLSDRGLSILDVLFSSESEEELEREFEGENVEVIKTEEDAEIFVENITNAPAPNEKLKTATESYLEASFRKMNEDKINELKNRIDTNKKEISRVRSEIKQSESKLDKMIEDTGVLETRLESMYGNEDPIGFVFNVSEEQKPEDIGLSEENRQIADKIADIVGLKKDVLFNMLTEGFYKIRIAPKDNFDSKEFEISGEVLERLTSIDLMGKFKRTETVGEFEYRGEMNWHQLVSKMIKKGFEQEPEFDKLCLSNSYDSKWSPSNENDEVESVEKTNEKEMKDNSDIEFSDVEPINVRTFNQPTNLVIVGTSNDNEDIKITDDHSSFEVFIGDNLHNGSYECDGFVSIMEVEQYKQWLSEQDLDEYDPFGGISCIYIPDFQGTIGVVAKTDDDDFTTDFDVDDYICHQINGYVYLTLPEGTTLIEMEDGKIPVSVLRDIKINNVLE